MAIKKFKNETELVSELKSCSKCLQSKFDGKDGKRHTCLFLAPRE